MKLLNSSLTQMHKGHVASHFTESAVFQLGLALLLLASVSACGSDSSNGQTVAVNLSLIVDAQQAQNSSISSRLVAWIYRWVPSAHPAWAQSVDEIANIQVQITGPGISSPATASVPVSNPSSGQEIPVSIQAPVGANRTIVVSAFNADSPPQKIFGGTLAGVMLTPGAPVNLEIVLVRLFTVIVEKQGSGSGTVTSSPVGIDCGVTCSGQFEMGTTVSLNAAAAAGSAFAGWGGDCSGSGACTVTGNAAVTTRFIVPAATNHLHVDRAGTGTGTVSSVPSGISCGSSCDADFESGTTVTVTAMPSDGSTFTNWTGGGCSGGAPSCTVVMNVNQSVTAIFTAVVAVPMSTLTVEKTGSGSGTVASAPSGINCGSTCSATFPTSNSVTLVPTAAAGSTFVRWTGACSGTGSCTLTMSNDQVVSAQFDLVPEMVTLTVNKSGRGDGTVTSNPGGIDCGQVCVATFLKDTQVTLTAVPNVLSVFNEWRGSDCNGNGTCTITMDSDKSVQAHFNFILNLGTD